MATSHFGNGNERLDSWKEISAYLKRGVRTVQRWEHEAGLPVHRLATEKRGVVDAYGSEIDVWWQSRSSVLAASDQATITANTGPPGAIRWRIPALITGAVLIAGSVVGYAF